MTIQTNLTPDDWRAIVRFTQQRLRRGAASDGVFQTLIGKKVSAQPLSPSPSGSGIKGEGERVKHPKRHESSSTSEFSWAS